VVSCENDGRDDLLRRSAQGEEGAGGSARVAPYCSALGWLWPRRSEALDGGRPAMAAMSGGRHGTLLGLLSRCTLGQFC
jgi:hypothetical protein